MCHDSCAKQGQYIYVTATAQPWRPHSTRFVFPLTVLAVFPAVPVAAGTQVVGVEIGTPAAVLTRRARTHVHLWPHSAFRYSTPIIQLFYSRSNRSNNYK